MKIVCKSNYDLESVSDRLVAENVNEHYGKFLVEQLNNRYSGDQSPDFFKLVDDDYVLYKFEP